MTDDLDPSECYLLFFETIQAIDDVFDIALKESRWDYRIGELRRELDGIVELTIAMAAAQGWRYAMRRNTFDAFWKDYSAFSESILRPYFDSR